MIEMLLYHAKCNKILSHYSMIDHLRIERMQEQKARRAGDQMRLVTKDFKCLGCIRAAQPCLIQILMLFAL